MVTGSLERAIAVIITITSVSSSAPGQLTKKKDAREKNEEQVSNGNAIFLNSCLHKTQLHLLDMDAMSTATVIKRLTSATALFCPREKANWL